jgi:Tol biopolymer transport system component
MDIHTLRRHIAARDAISILETVDVTTGVRSVLKEFDQVIEAPNWTRDGRLLVYNAGRSSRQQTCGTAARPCRRWRIPRSSSCSAGRGRST